MFRGSRFAECEPANDEHRSPAKRVAKKDSAEGQIEALAKKMQKSGESIEQATVRALRTCEGPKMYAAYRDETRRNIDGTRLQKRTEPAAVIADSAEDQLDALAKAEQDKNGGSEHQAMARVLKTREGRKLYAEHKRVTRKAA